MTNTATLNTSNKNTINYAGERRRKEKRLKNKTKTNLSKTSQHTNRAIIKQSKTNSKKKIGRERETERERITKSY